MQTVLVTISKGIIDHVVFFDDPKLAVQTLSKYVKNMNIEHDEAAVYDQNGFIANAKHFLDENDEYLANQELIEDVSKKGEKPMYIIGNSKHPLGFMVASPDDPLSYESPLEALSDLGQMKKDFGNHLRLYRVIPVNRPVAHKADLENHNDDCGLDDFDYELVKEYLF